MKAFLGRFMMAGWLLLAAIALFCRAMACRSRCGLRQRLPVCFGLVAPEITAGLKDQDHRKNGCACPEENHLDSVFLLYSCDASSVKPIDLSRRFRLMGQSVLDSL